MMNKSRQRKQKDEQPRGANLFLDEHDQMRKVVCIIGTLECNRG